VSSCLSVCKSFCGVYCSLPPDPINHLFSLTGQQSSEKYFTFRSVQIFQILFRGFYSPESDPPLKIMQYWFYYSTQLAFSVPPDQNVRAEIFCTTERYQLPRGFSGRPALKYFAWFIGAGGWLCTGIFWGCINLSKSSKTPILRCVVVFECVYVFLGCAKVSFDCL